MHRPLLLGLLAVLSLETSAQSQVTDDPCLNVPSEVECLGPGVESWSSRSGIVVGEKFYLGSRALAPARLAAFDLPSGTAKIVASDLGSEGSIVALAIDETRNSIYMGNFFPDPDESQIYRWNRDTEEIDLEVYIPDFKIGALAVADSMLYASGRKQGAVAYEIDPDTQTFTEILRPDSLGDWNYHGSHAIEATDEYVFVGADNRASGDAEQRFSGLFAWNRETGEVWEDEDGKTNLLCIRLFYPTPSSHSKFCWRRYQSALEVIDSRLYVTSGNGFGVLDLSTNDFSKEFIEPSVAAGRGFTQGNDGNIYFGKNAFLRYEPGGQSSIDTLSAPLEVFWGIDHHDGKILAAASDKVISYEILTGETDTVNLLEIENILRPHAPQSIAAGQEWAYVAGNKAIGVHKLNPDGTWNPDNLFVPGEAKASLVKDEILYAAVYSRKGLFRFDPTSDDEPEKLADFGRKYNRPVKIEWDGTGGSDRLLTLIKSDTAGGGELLVYDRVTGDTAHYGNEIPLLPPRENSSFRMPTSVVALNEDVALVGGSRYLSAISLTDRDTVWTFDHGQGSAAYSMVINGNYLYAMRRNGTFFVFHTGDREIVHEGSLNEDCLNTNYNTNYPHKDPDLTFANAGQIYGATRECIFQIDPNPPYTATTLVTGLNGDWRPSIPMGPEIEFDGHCRVYTMSERNLVRLQVHHCGKKSDLRGGVGDDALPDEFSLDQNTPNPVSGETEIRFALPETAQVTLVVYDALGREVTRLIDGEREAGVHSVSFDASGLSAGVYMYRIQAENFTQSRRMLVVR